MIPGDWADDAACKDVPQDDFFSESKDAIARAAAFCHRCPVREKCLEFALATDTTYGMYGGCTPGDRKKIADRQRRRPDVERPTPRNPAAKWCPTCATELPFHRFKQNKARPDGLHGECTTCANRRQASREKAS